MVIPDPAIYENAAQFYLRSAKVYKYITYIVEFLNIMLPAVTTMLVSIGTYIPQYQQRAVLISAIVLGALSTVTATIYIKLNPSKISSDSMNTCNAYQDLAVMIKQESVAKRRDPADFIELVGTKDSYIRSQAPILLCCWI